MTKTEDPGYEVFVSRLDEEYLRAWDEMSEEERQALDSAGIRPDTGHDGYRGFSNGSQEDQHENPMLSEAEHVTDRLDTEVDFIMERWDVDRQCAEEILEYVHRSEDRAVNLKCMSRLHRVIGLLISPCDDLQAVLWGLVYATGMEHYVADPSGRSMLQKARELGVSRALIQTYKDRFRDILKLKNNIHGKSDHHREACRKAQTEDHWRSRTGGDLIRGKI
jgi:hypothetical protein